MDDARGEMQGRAHVPPAPPHARRGRFFSLKWKALAIVSVVLATIHVGLVWQGYNDALAQFEARQALAFEDRVTVLQRLLVQSQHRLQRIANIVPGVVDAINLRKGLDEQWAGMQLELQLDVMQLYGPAGRLLVRGMPRVDTAASPQTLQRIAAAMAQERPAGFIVCEPLCTQFAVVPVLGISGERRLMVLGTSLADVVLEFPGLTGAGVAVLARGAESVGGRYWDDYRLVAISDAPSNEPKLRALSQAAPLPGVEQGYGLKFGGRHYRFYARPFAAFDGVSPGHFVIFADTTQALADIDAQLRRQLLAGLMALLAALVLLLALMNRPMNQLRKLAQALPLLAQHQYGPVRQMIGTQYHQARSHTEIEVLESVAVDLARQLEELEKTVEVRNHALAEKVAELRRANELNERIFSTAPMLILIQSNDLSILQMNEFGRHLLGYSESELRGMPFLSLLAEARQRDETATVLVEVLGGRRSVFEQTGPVICVDGTRERVTWLHSRLAAHSGTYVLSVGLPDKSQDDHYLPT